MYIYNIYIYIHIYIERESKGKVITYEFFNIMTYGISYVCETNYMFGIVLF